MTQILPSIFGAGILQLKDEIEFLEREGMAILYVDMVDDNFVSNITFGPNQMGAMEKTSKMMFDVHTMIDHPKDHPDDVTATGAKMISAHYESTPHIHNMTQCIRKTRRKVGVVLNPDTPESVLEYLLDNIDYVLIMTINPGIPNQTFIERNLGKIVNLKKVIGNCPIQIEVDGGVNDVIVKQMADAGAGPIVVDGYLSGGDPDERYSVLREAVKQKLRQSYGMISMTPQEQRGWYKDERI